MDPKSVYVYYIKLHSDISVTSEILLYFYLCFSELIPTQLILFSSSLFFLLSIGGVFHGPCQYVDHQWRSVFLPGPLFALGLPPRSERPPFVSDNLGDRKAKMTG